MKVCVLQSSYDDSDSPLTEVDDFDCTPAHFFNDPDFMFTSVKLSKANAYTEIRKLAHSKQFDVFLNLCDGSKEEGRAGIEVVLALEELELPFTGSPAAFYEPTKIDMKKMAYDQGISFPNYVLKKSLHELDAVEHELKFPVIVKHPMGYSSIGMLKDAKCFSVSELKRASQFFIENFGSVLIEEFIAGREVTVLAFEDGQSNDVHAFEPVQIRFPSGEDFKHFDLKWKDFSDMTWTTMNSSDQVLAERCMEVGKKAFKSMLGGIGYGRLLTDRHP